MASISGLVVKAKQVEQELAAGGLTAKFFNFFQGRATWFALVFLTMITALVVVGIWGFIHGKDLTPLAAFTAAVGGTFLGIQTMVFAHSAKEDWNDYKNRQLDIQQAQGAPPPSIVVNNQPQS